MYFPYFNWRVRRDSPPPALSSPCANFPCQTLRLWYSLRSHFARCTLQPRSNFKIWRQKRRVFIRVFFSLSLLTLSALKGTFRNNRPRHFQGGHRVAVAIVSYKDGKKSISRVFLFLSKGGPKVKTALPRPFDSVCHYIRRGT